MAKVSLQNNRSRVSNKLTILLLLSTRSTSLYQFDCQPTPIPQRPYPLLHALHSPPILHCSEERRRARTYHPGLAREGVGPAPSPLGSDHGIRRAVAQRKARIKGAMVRVIFDRRQRRKSSETACTSEINEKLMITAFMQSQLPHDIRRKFTVTTPNNGWFGQQRKKTIRILRSLGSISLAGLFGILIISHLLLFCNLYSVSVCIFLHRR
jgi:hypothetical protein